ncbi:MAG: serine/threonine-protein kinase, partial [Polyangiales bacterium]
MSPPVSGKARILGRYALYDEIASGGMASVHYGRLLGPVGFARTVAIKRLHPQFAKDPEFVSMFLDEARLAARIRHPNVVPTLDVVAEDKELFLVMEYVEGESLARLLRLAKAKGQRIPLDMLVAIVAGVLHGLHSAHEARGEGGEALGIVHRDVSPQNILVGVDGVPRVLDFGIAKAAGRLQTTAEGQLKGKVAYMPPEQIQGAVTRRTDVYAMTVVLWEALVGERLFAGDSPINTLNNVLTSVIARPSARLPSIPRSFDDVVMKGLSRDPRERFATAKEMARALEQCERAASTSDLGEWVASMAGDTLSQRAVAVAEIESDSRGSKPAHIIPLPPVAASSIVTAGAIDVEP